MQLDADDLLAQIRQDYPVEFELCQLRLLSARQAEEIQRLTASVSPTSTYAGSAGSLYSPDSQEGRHG